MEIRKLEIDFDRDILKINGEPVTGKPVKVNLPGPFGWPFRKLFNAELATGNPEECDRLEVIYKKPSNKPL